MKTNIALLNRAGRWFGTGYMLKPNNPFRRRAGSVARRAVAVPAGSQRQGAGLYDPAYFHGNLWI